MMIFISHERNISNYYFIIIGAIFKPVIEVGSLSRANIRIVHANWPLKPRIGFHALKTTNQTNAMTSSTES